LIDEADAFLKDNEELRGIINSGHSRDTAYVLRTVGEDHTPTKFNTFCCKAIAGIGRQAGTIEDRSIVITLQRKTPEEKIKRLRHIDPEKFRTLRAKLARFAEDHGSAVGRATPELPDVLNDREMDNWEPLIAVAELAGTDWLKEAIEAALALSGADNATQSRSMELLTDIKAIFDCKRTKTVFTRQLIMDLCIDPEKAWATYDKGKPITARQVARLLKGFGIKSKDIREGDLVHKGYSRADFESVFSRYISTHGVETGNSSATTLQTNGNNNLSQFSCRYNEELVADKKGLKSSDLFNSSAVADKNTETVTLTSCSDKTPIKRFNLQGEQVVGSV
jgi:putative DNA primase/helicase